MGFDLGSSSLLSSSSSSSLLLCSHRNLTRKKRSSVPIVSLRNAKTQEESNSSQRRSFIFMGISVLPLLQLKATAAEDLDTASTLVSQASGLATVFLSPRNRTRDLKLKTSELPSNSTSKDKKDIREREEQEPEFIISEKKDIGKQEIQGAELTKQGTSFTEAIQAEHVPTQEARGNTFVSLFNVFGIIAAGVLGALYATSQKEKTAMESTIESVILNVWHRRLPPAHLWLLFLDMRNLHD